MSTEGQSSKRDPDPVIALILLRIRLYSRKRIKWLRKIWQEEIEQRRPGIIDHIEIDGILDYLDSPDKELFWQQSDKEISLINKEIEEVEDKIVSYSDSRYNKLVKIFNLCREECDPPAIVLCCFN